VVLNKSFSDHFGVKAAIIDDRKLIRITNTDQLVKPAVVDSSRAFTLEITSKTFVKDH